MQHFRRLAATFLMVCLTGAGVGAGAALPALAQDAPSGGGVVQRGVPAEATAENAVVARTRAIASAQRLAYERMASELGLSRGNLSDSQIDALVDSIIVEQERTTRTGYSGRLTVNFNPGRVGVRSGTASAAASGSSSGGAAPASDAAPPIPPPLAATHVEAVAGFASLGEWLELRRRLLASPEVASVEIQAIAVDGARLRLGLRHTPDLAAQALPMGGVQLFGAGAQPASAPGTMPRPVPYGGAPQPAGYAPLPGAGPWQIGLARGT